MRSKASVGFIDKKKKKIYEEKTKIIKEFEEQEKQKIKQNKDSENDPLKEKEYVNNIPVNPKEQKQLIGKNVSNDSLKLNPYVKSVNYESNNKINQRFNKFNYNFLQPP